ncbi:hypothetical protein TSUD_160100 [Trifolium subterraneum]|uniref:D-isomer specific 2-hydroxyacid dehydrogenase NAD-binding domain-containing protein n=1 Tax=Trifolium subterraneum TaxID=3900 RepID=A0A2Z6MW12_TRISU|nr:hypothetical protein TSUD_160100 [Trifolium subterraneum]
MLALRNKGVIVNVGRGSLIDEEELNEPNVPQQLLSLDIVVLSPHNAAFTTETYMAATQLVEDNLEAFFSNKPLLTLLFYIVVYSSN